MNQLSRRAATNYARAAQHHCLLIAELNEVGMGIGTREELEALIADGILPKGTILREAQPGDF